MPDINQLMERRATNWSQYQEVLERANGNDSDLSGEDRSQLDRLEESIRTDTADIERLQRAGELERAITTVTPPSPVAQERDAGPGVGEQRDAEYAAAFGSFLRFGMERLDGPQRQLLQGGFVDGSELRAAGVATGSAGGYLVPAEYRRVMTETMKFFSSMRQVANVITTDTGANLPWPSNDDTGNKGAILAENTQVTEQDVTIGTTSLDAYMYTSKLVRVSLQLLQDSGFDIDTWLPRKLGERIGRIHEEHFTTGTGSSQPDGVATSATSGVTAASATAVTFDELISLIHSVDVAYRNERSRFMLADASVANVRKLKDSDGKYLWEPSTQVGQPDALLGYPVSINNEMPAMTTGNKSILFGDFYAGYVVRDVTGVQQLRLTERYADYLQVGFLAFQRSDGTLDDAAAIRALTQA